MTTELFAPEPAGLVTYTEADLIALLRTKYGKTHRNGNTETIRYVGASHVRYGPLAGYCIADFLVQDTWGNYGPLAQRHPVIGFEIKVSRSDYLREIKDLNKSWPIRSVCAQWYIVAAHESIVKDDLPKDWGLMVPTKRGLRTVVAAYSQINPAPMPRELIAGFLRAVAMQNRSAVIS